MKKIYSTILLSLLFYSSQLYAQETKLSISLERYVNKVSLNPTRAAETMPVLVKGDINKIRSYTLSHGGVFKYSVANKFASITLPIATIKDFSQSSFVARVEGVYNLPSPMSDSVGCHQSYVFPVHNDSTPLTRDYLGDSVIIGIVDGGGFYFRHKDFRQQNDTTKTRFLYIWDQTENNVPSPSPFNYGAEWDSAAINAGTCTEGDDEYDYSHGTNCIGVAAGNGQSFSPSEAYISAAPKADIIGVKFQANSQYWLDYVVDATNYIYAKADSLHEPCVITFSYGTYLGSHDGLDLVTQMIDSLITEHTGHTFVAACGDGGNIPFHLGYTATADSQFTYFLPSGTEEAFEFWINTNQASNFNFAVGVDDTSNWQYRGRTPYFNIADWNGLPTNTGLGFNLLSKNGDTICKNVVYEEQEGNAYHFYVYILTDSITYYFRFITQGSGRFDLWSDLFSPIATNTWVMGSHYYQNFLPTVSKLPAFATYQYPDSFQTICSGIQCSPDVISVANYTNRDNWVECGGSTYNNSANETPGNLSATSSWGPTRDGRTEPDITAPGDESIAPGDSFIVAAYRTNSDSFKVAKGCVYNRNGGTSMAAPFAAGVAALYLEKYPTATWKEVKAAIDTCAYKDNFTGNIPISYEWGYGKIDAYCIMQIDTPTGIGILSSNKVSLTNYPNPFNDYTNIVYSLGNMGYQSAEIDVYDMIGKKISTLPLKGSSGSILFNNNNLPEGMYIYRLVVDQKPVATGKLIILY